MTTSFPTFRRWAEVGQDPRYWDVLGSVLAGLAVGSAYFWCLFFLGALLAGSGHGPLFFVGLAVAPFLFEWGYPLAILVWPIACAAVMRAPPRGVRALVALFLLSHYSAVLLEALSDRTFDLSIAGVMESYKDQPLVALIATSVYAATHIFLWSRLRPLIGRQNVRTESASRRTRR